MAAKAQTSPSKASSDELPPEYSEFPSNMAGSSSLTEPLLPPQPTLSTTTEASVVYIPVPLESLCPAGGMLLKTYISHSMI